MSNDSGMVESHEIFRSDVTVSLNNICDCSAENVESTKNISAQGEYNNRLFLCWKLFIFNVLNTCLC